MRADGAKLANILHQSSLPCSRRRTQVLVNTKARRPVVYLGPTIQRSKLPPPAWGMRTASGWTNELPDGFQEPSVAVRVVFMCLHPPFCPRVCMPTNVLGVDACSPLCVAIEPGSSAHSVWPSAFGWMDGWKDGAVVAQFALNCNIYLHRAQAD